MQMTPRELWTALHGMVFGAVYLLAFGAAFLSLWELRSNWLTPEGEQRATRRLILATWGMAIFAWITVVTGSYIVYPWYRAKAPAGSHGTALSAYPKYLLISSEHTAEWHEFGMEWKEHIGWFVPILATAVAYIATQSRRRLASDAPLRRAVLMLQIIAFTAASVAGVFGALINKVGPVR